MKPGGAWQTKLLCAAVVALYLAASCHAAPALGTSRPETGQGAAPGQSGAEPVSTFPINETLAYPLGVTTDHSGDVWYAEDNLDALVELIPSNSTTRTFAIPTPHHLAWIWFMVFDQGGVLWFSDESQQLIWSFNPATETFANYTAGGAYPFALQYDQQRSRIWFTSLRTDQVGYFAIEGGTAILEKTANFSAPQPGSGVSGIAVDSAGNLYVAESFQAKIVELDGTTLSIVRTWSLPVGSQPVGLALDQPRGRLWFTDHASSFFGYVDLNSTGQTLFSTSLFFAGGANAVTLPYWISLSASGDVWFNEHSANRIARFDPSTLQLTEFVIPTNDSSPLMLSLDDKRGEVWFTEFSGNALGMIAQNSTGGGSVSSDAQAAAADPTATFTATATPASESPPTVSLTAESTGEPQPGFEVSSSPQGSAYKIELTAYQAPPGSYTAAICFGYASTNQCGYVQVSVPTQASALPLLYSVYAIAGLGVAALVLALFRETRRGRPGRPP